MLDIARDPRWGRVVEGAGEDPYLGSAMAAAQMKGFQGDDLAAKDTMLATAKHFAGYGAVTAGRDSNAVDLPPRLVRDDSLPTVRARYEERRGGEECVRTGGARRSPAKKQKKKQKTT